MAQRRKRQAWVKTVRGLDGLASVQPSLAFMVWPRSSGVPRCSTAFTGGSRSATRELMHVVVLAAVAPPASDRPQVGGSSTRGPWAEASGTRAAVARLAVAR